MSTMKVTDVGPVKELAIPLEPGTITLLRGPNNSGKSRTLDAASRALGGEEKIAARHDAGKPGKIEYGDLTMTIGRSTRTKGQTECLGLAGRFDVSELIDPPQKTADLADAHRTKVLCRLTGVEADGAVFASLSPNKEPLTGTDKDNDACDLAGVYKRWFEVKRREVDREADHQRGEAKAAKEAVGDTDLDGECDSEALQTKLQEAMTARTRMEEQTKAARENNERVAEAKAAIKDAEDAYGGPCVDDAAAAVADYALDADTIAKERDIAQAVLRTIAEKSDKLDFKANLAKSALAEATRHDAVVAEWKTQVAKGETPPPLTTNITYTEDAVADAHQAVEAGALIRKAREHNAAYITAREETEKAEKESEHWAKAATEVWPTLAKMLDVEGMTLRDGRWYVDVDGRELLFHDQSDGFRTTAALDLLATTARKAEPDRPIVAVLQQPNWEALDADNRKRVAQKVRDTAISLVTAQADHEAWPEGERPELRAETFDNG